MSAPKQSELTDLPNIGVVLAKLLTQVGITTPQELVSVGSENAFIRLKTVDPTACLSKLHALEGAIQGIRWHSMDKNRREELHIFFKTIK